MISKEEALKAFKKAVHRKFSDPGYSKEVDKTVKVYSEACEREKSADKILKQTFINIIQGCRSGRSRKDICDFARNALAIIDKESLKVMDESFKSLPWYYKNVNEIEERNV